MLSNLQQSSASVTYWSTDYESRFFVWQRKLSGKTALLTAEVFTLSYKTGNEVFAQNFEQAAVKAAIVRAQKGEVMYPEFKKLTQKAGCIGYFVWIKGRHVSYLGRNGETHIEHFPC